MAEASEGYVTVRDAEPCSMVSLRADLGLPEVAAALRAEGFPVPAPRRIERGAAWMAPDELLLFAPAGAGPDLAARLDAALTGIHHSALDVSDLRCGFTLDGAAVREVLAKLTPADTAAITIGEFRRTRLAQIAAAFWLTSKHGAEVLVFRSVHTYALHLLRSAARVGSEVG